MLRDWRGNSCDLRCMTTCPQCPGRVGPVMACVGWDRRSERAGLCRTSGSEHSPLERGVPQGLGREPGSHSKLQSDQVMLLCYSLPQLEE